MSSPHFSYHKSIWFATDSSRSYHNDCFPCLIICSLLNFWFTLDASFFIVRPSLLWGWWKIARLLLVHCSLSWFILWSWPMGSSSLPSAAYLMTSYFRFFICLWHVNFLISSLRWSSDCIKVGFTWCCILVKTLQVLIMCILCVFLMVIFRAISFYCTVHLWTAVLPLYCYTWSCSQKLLYFISIKVYIGILLHI